MKIWHKILLGFLGVFVLISLSGVPTETYYQRIIEAIRLSSEQDQIAMQMVDATEIHLLEMESCLWQYLASGDPANQKYFQDRRKHWQILSEQMADLLKADPHMILILKRADRAATTWIQQVEPLMGAPRNGQKTVIPRLDDVRVQYQQLRKEQSRRLTEGYEYSVNTVERSSNLTWFLRGLALAVGLFTCWLVVRSVKHPLERLISATARISDGHFDSTVPVSNDELGQLSQSFNAMSRTLKERTEALEEQRRLAVQANVLKTEFLANTSHELRTPLNTIMGYTQLILDKLARNPDEEKNYLSIIQQSSKHLLSLINDVLDISKIETGQMRLELDPILLKPLLDQVNEHLRLPASQKCLQLTIFQSAPDLWVQAHPGRLKQVLFNLLGNAIKFTPHGSVRLEARPDETRNRICFEIRDTGIGIPKDKQQLLFQKFVQVDGSLTRQIGGTGLGLALSKSLIELMGGEISLSSEGEGCGSSVVFSLPKGKIT
ncbi:MAG: ATP-binding protein [Verrucomicrobiae bacterium]|nr:ATP-binding protein [Verrucomicrobiae bacterium]